MKALILILLPIHMIAQDITGLWTGTLYTSGNELPYELVISKSDDKLSGYSLTVFLIDGVENTGMKTMKIKSKNGKITIEDDELIGDNYSTKPKRMMLYGILSLSGRDSSLILSGSFNTRAYNNAGYKGTMILKRKTHSPNEKLIARLTQMNLLHSLSFINKPIEKEKIIASSTTAKKDPEPKKGNQFADSIIQTSKPVIKPPVAVKTATIKPPAADISKRKIETVQTIFFKLDSIKLTLYDNGQVDGDTVTVVANGETVLAKQRLTEKAINHTLYIAPGQDSLQIVMYAENLGLIAPNTGLLVIQDGDARYEVRFSGDLQKNSAIVLKRKR